MSIYTPYTYLIGWSSINKFYYGRRTARGYNPTDLWTKYFTSSKVVQEYRKLHGEPDVIQIRQTFCDAKKCAQWECIVLERIDAQHNPKYLNQRSGDYKWDTTGIQNFGSSNHRFGTHESEITKSMKRDYMLNWHKNNKHPQLGIKGESHWNSKQYIIKSPLGITYHVTGLTNFCREHKLNRNSMMKMAKGEKKSYKGWCCSYNN